MPDLMEFRKVLVTEGSIGRHGSPVDSAWPAPSQDCRAPVIDVPAEAVAIMTITSVAAFHRWFNVFWVLAGGRTSARTPDDLTVGGTKRSQ